MKSAKELLAIVSALLIASGFAVAHADSTVPPDNQNQGWLEGIVVSDAGVPVNAAQFSPGVTITGTPRSGGAGFQVTTNPSYGGLFRVERLPPGVYDIAVPSGVIGTSYYGSQQINGVVVQPGVRTKLNVTMYPTSRPITIGDPAPVPQPVAQQLTTHARNIHELELQVDALQKQIIQLQNQIAQLQARTSATAQQGVSPITPTHGPLVAAPPSQ